MMSGRLPGDRQHELEELTRLRINIIHLIHLQSPDLKYSLPEAYDHIKLWMLAGQIVGGWEYIHRLYVAT